MAVSIEKHRWPRWKTVGDPTETSPKLCFERMLKTVSEFEFVFLVLFFLFFCVVGALNVCVVWGWCWFVCLFACLLVCLFVWLC